MTLHCPVCRDEEIELSKDQFISNVLDSGQPICPECGEDLEVKDES